jgi:hypothetical protein
LTEGPAVIDLQPHDDLATLRYRLDEVRDGRVVLRLPWDLRFLSRELDFELLRRSLEARDAGRRQLKVAIVSPDPERRQLAHGCGFPTFASVEAAAAARRWNGPGSQTLEPPPSYWWEEEPDLHPSSKPWWRRVAPVWLDRLKDGVRFAAFLLVIVVLAASAYAVIPTAEITVVPAGETVTVSVPVSVDPELEADGVGGIIPSRRVGIEVEGHAEVATTEVATVAAGRATGEVLFTSRLAQDYVVPAGTVVRTSSTSYPIRFRTTADVVVPANGQATAPIQALDERTGNVGAFQINRVEGMVASAVRVMNPEPTTGAEAKEVPVVVQADYDRVREQLTGELLDQAYVELQGLLEPDEFLPYQSLRVEAVPKKAYTHFIGEQSETVGLNMRLLVSGQAVNAEDARSVARRALLEKLPAGYRLVDAGFDIGEVVEDEEGPGWFTFYVAGRGYAAAAIGEQEVIAEVRGKRIPDARAQLQRSFPLGQPPQFTTWPTWPEWLAQLDRVPLIPLRVDVHVTPQVPGAREGAAAPSSTLAFVPGG